MFPVKVKCPHCKKSLMDNEVLVDGVPSIKVEIEAEGNRGFLWLSSYYGSFNYELNINIREQIIANLYCPYCHENLKTDIKCYSCMAPMAQLELEKGGFVRICTRKGCKKHSIYFYYPDQVIVSNFMTREIIAVYEDDTLEDVAKIMVEKKLRALPVLSRNERVVGIIAQESLLEYLFPEKIQEIDFVSAKKILKLIAPWNQVKAGEIMDTDYPTINPEASLVEAGIEIMRHKAHILLVIKEGIPVGVISNGEVSRALLDCKLQELSKKKKQG